MDFRFASDMLSNQETTQEEIISQIINLPCIYAVFKEDNSLFCLDIIDDNTQGEMQVPLLYSNLELVMEAVKKFRMPSEWYIAQWTDVQEALTACKELNVKGAAFDSLPTEDTINGLVIDQESLQELLSISC